ncbi:MAG TPA: cation diffusion facilitator family transporter [Deltaproteobacteria bacterium]|nr:cation diffusion facilitator family transporter [Deltaproteobacteria bacterium]HIJ35670.1 cation diffusion facilitator family transporter [Deltaproteobacteria bacterium]HIJ39455.1 cation diffusion facilitator family transporter [Deltaproteobacteria bacterium]
MKKFTRWVVLKSIKDHQQIDDLKVRAKYGALEGWTSIVINILLFAVKISIGLSIKSVALIADAVHTLADSVTSVVVIIGFKIARKASDEEHPFGHGRTEAVATLIVAVLLFIAGFELLKESIQSISGPQASAASPGVILIIAATIIIKELMARFAYQLGDMIDSQALKADALHHRTDVLATGLVVVALVAAHFGFRGVDGIMGAFVSLIIFYSAYSIAKEAVSPLLGEAPSPETIMEIEGIASAFEGVQGVHDIIYHKYGQTVIVSLHIEVSDKASAFELHALSEAVEERIGQKFGGTVIAHVDPINMDHPEYHAIERKIAEIISKEQRVRSFHDLRIIGCSLGKCSAVFDIVLEKEEGEKERYDIVRFVSKRVREEFPGMKTVIKVDPRFAYTPMSKRVAPAL